MSQSSNSEVLQSPQIKSTSPLTEQFLNQEKPRTQRVFCLPSKCIPSANKVPLRLFQQNASAASASVFPSRIDLTWVLSTVKLRSEIFVVFDPSEKTARFSGPL